MINCVVSRYKKNVNWVYNLKNINDFFIYEKEMPESRYNIPVNKGNEASVYLKYIVDHYDTLADFTFFIHDEEYAWHHKGSVVNLLDEAVLSNKLYYNINTWILGGIKAEVKLYDDICKFYKQFIEKYIPLSSLPNPDWTHGHRGCAQFLVHKSLITKLPLQFYQDLYNWIITTDLSNYWSGRYLEYTWHIFWDIYPNL